MRFHDITVIVPKALGATLLSTVVLRQIKQSYPRRALRCVAKHIDVLRGSPYIDELIEWDDPEAYTRAIQDKEVVDLTGTLDYQPNRRAFPVHLIDLLCRRAGVSNDLKGPDCFLSSAELDSARKCVDSLKVESSKAVIAITTRTSTRNKEWRHEQWQELVKQLSTHVTWLHLGESQSPRLSGVEYLWLTPRQDVALTRFVDGVITLDTFLLHAAATQRLSTARVITLLGSSRPECVSYPAFHNIFFNIYDCQPCGRPYNSFDLRILHDGGIDYWPNGKPKKWECEHVACMDLINVSTVADAVRSLILKKVLTSEVEHSLLLIKPDAVRAGVSDEILEVLSNAGLRVMLRRRVRLTTSQVERLYSEHTDKDFFPHLVEFMASDPCEVCIVEGDDAVNRLNDLCGHNDPRKATPGTLRKVYGTGKSENAVHSPSDPQSFYAELRLLLQVEDVSSLPTEAT